MPSLENKVVTHITLYTDASTQNRPPYIYAKQYDANSRYLVARIVDSNKDIAVTGVAQLNATKPDGTRSYIAGTANEDGTVTIGLTANLLAVEGKISCDITVFDSADGDQVLLTTSTFFILVDESNYDSDAIESTDEFSTVSDTLTKIAADRAATESARDEAVSAAEETQAILRAKADGLVIDGSRLYLTSDGNKIDGSSVEIVTDLTEVYKAIDEKADGFIIEDSKLYLTSEGVKITDGIPITTGLHEIVKEGDCVGSVVIGTTAMAISDGAMSFGKNTIAGSRGFRIKSSSGVNGGVGTYTLDGYDGGYEEGDIYSLRIDNVYDYQGMIKEINGNVITVDNFAADALVAVDKRYYIKGVWGWKGVTLQEFQTYVNFISGGKQWDFVWGASVVGVQYNNSSTNDYAEACDTASLYEDYKYMDFGDEWQEIDQTFYDVITAYATSDGTGESKVDGSYLGDENTFRVTDKPTVGNVDIGVGATSFGCNTKATGRYSHAKGCETKADGFASNADGERTEARSYGSSASGGGTIAASRFQRVIGKFNKIDDEDKYALIVGNGESDTARSNAFAVTWGGDIELAGKKLDTEAIVEAAEEAKQVADEAKQIAEDTNQFARSGTFANALKGSTTGAAVRMDDVSPVEHEMAVKVSSINIFDSKSIVIGGLAGNTGADWVTDTNVRSEYMTIKPNTTYYFGGSDIKWNRIHEYDKNRTWIRRIVLNTDGSITTSGNAAFLRVSFIKSDNSSFTEDELTTIRQEKMWMSDIAKVYTPYIEDVSTVKVLQHGKNLFPYPYDFTTSTKNGVTCSINNDGGISVYGMTTVSTGFDIQKVKVKKGIEYTLSLDLSSEHFSSNTCQVWVRNKEGALSEHLYLVCRDKPKKFIPINDGYIIITVQVYPNHELDLRNFHVLLELGNKVTDHEQYIEPSEHSVNADGTAAGVTLLSPTTTLMTDVEGAIIDVEYNRDINKAFAELQQAILNLL